MFLHLTDIISARNSHAQFLLLLFRSGFRLRSFAKLIQQDYRVDARKSVNMIVEPRSVMLDSVSVMQHT